MRVIVFTSRLAAALLVMGIPAWSSTTRDQTAEDAMRQFLARPRVAHRYTAARRLEASGVGQRGWLEAQIDFTPESGLLYVVTAEGGSRYIRTRVLRSLLDEEQQLIARAAEPSVDMTTDNYQFTPEGVDPDGFAVVALRPLRKELGLITGRMFLTVDGDLVRVEGQLAKAPTFWISRVKLVRSYQAINGVPMPVLLQSTAQLKLLGSSSLRMTYRYVEVDGRAVDSE